MYERIRECAFCNELRNLLFSARDFITPESTILSIMRSCVETSMEYSKWLDTIPFIPFKSDWIVKPIPPFGGAIVRFYIAHKNNHKKCVSVFLDGYHLLGHYYDENLEPVPYWEVYPVDGDIVRVKMENVDELLKVIEEALAN